MLIDVSGVCQKCKSDVSILVNDGAPQGECQECGEAPFAFKRLEGIIHVVSNPNQRGVKIGRTTKSVHDRIKQLNSTGVAGSFEPIAIFPSKNTKKDEKKAHEKLKRFHLEKEHFDIHEVEAVLKTHRALRTTPIFFNDDIEERFKLKAEQAKIEMKLKIKGKV